MVNDKNTNFDDNISAEESEFAGDASSRARNRTVMLTPEITGEVRARLAQDMDQSGVPSTPMEDTAAPNEETEGGSYIPSGGHLGSSPNPGNSTSSRPSHDPSSLQSPVVEHHAPPVQATANPAPARPAPAVMEPVDEGVVWAKKSPIIGFLVSYDEDPNGTVFQLRTGRLIVTSEAPGAGNFLIVNDESVSPMHAIMRISEDTCIQVLDQLSEFGTKIERFKTGAQEELSGDKSSLEHGDIIYFGNRKFYVCIVTRDEEE